jgi:hypothetical protein
MDLLAQRLESTRPLRRLSAAFASFLNYTTVDTDSARSRAPRMITTA